MSLKRRAFCKKKKKIGCISRSDSLVENLNAQRKGGNRSKRGRRKIANFYRSYRKSTAAFNWCALLPRLISSLHLTSFLCRFVIYLYWAAARRASCVQYRAAFFREIYIARSYYTTTAENVKSSPTSNICFLLVIRGVPPISKFDVFY